MKYVHLIILVGIGFVFSSPLMAGQDDPRLKSLFNNLALSKNVDEAQSTENLIWNIWLENKSPPVANVMALGIQAMNAGHLKAALQAFNEVVNIAPTFAEGWNKRATIYFLLQDFPASVKDIAETLRLEPKHFGALSGLGLINAALGRHQAAIKAYEQTLAIHPFAVGARKQIDKLKEILKGEET
jgi:tetratricopeptide (TPR) repeat protein